MIASKLCLYHLPCSHNMATTSRDCIPRILSIRKLLALPIEEVLIEIAVRCQLQFDHLHVYPENRQISILKSLYKDTIKSLGIFKSPLQHFDGQILSRLRESQIESLDTRHGMVTETLADALIALNTDKSKRSPQIWGPSRKVQDLSLAFLHRQTSILTLLQHGVGLTSSKYYCATGCVVESDMMALCIGVKNQAETLANHQFNWSPDIVIRHLVCTDDLGRSVDDCRICCIPSFIRFSLLEVFKNALYATAELNNAANPSIAKLSSSPHFDISDGDFEIPCVHVDIITYPDSIDICVTDEGTGMTSGELEHASRFLWASTINPRLDCCLWLHKILFIAFFDELL